MAYYASEYFAIVLGFLLLPSLGRKVREPMDLISLALFLHF